MKAGERILVKSQYLEGMATVLFNIPNEFYPLQVEMDNPDLDGHKIHRIAYHEVVKGEKKDILPVNEHENSPLPISNVQQMSFFDLI